MKTKKDLQKFTEIENLKTAEEVKKFYLKNPELKKDIWINISDRITENYTKGLGNEHELEKMLIEIMDNEEAKTKIRNITYETNHSIITSCIHNHLIDNRCFPSLGTIMSETNLSRQTIYKHLKNGITDNHNKLVKGKNEIMALSALSKLYLIGVEQNNATALKHYIELSGFNSTKPTTNVNNNYIQINNLKLSKDEFSQLPNETILEIETIISNSINKKTT